MAKTIEICSLYVLMNLNIYLLGGVRCQKKT